MRIFKFVLVAICGDAAQIYRTVNKIDVVMRSQSHDEQMRATFNLPQILKTVNCTDPIPHMISALTMGALVLLITVHLRCDTAVPE